MHAGGRLHNGFILPPQPVIFDTGLPQRSGVRFRCIAHIDAPGACSGFGSRTSEWCQPRGHRCIAAEQVLHALQSRRKERPPQQLDETDDLTHHITQRPCFMGWFSSRPENSVKLKAERRGERVDFSLCRNASILSTGGATWPSVCQGDPCRDASGLMLICGRAMHLIYGGQVVVQISGVCSPQRQAQACGAA